MEHKIIKNQRGYLLIIVSILTVVVGLVSVMLVNMYLGAMRSTTNILQADQALYIAKSGLEMAKRDLLKATAPMTCEAIGTKYNKFIYPSGNSNYPGVFSVRGEERNLATSLVAFIDGWSTSLNLSNNPGLLSAGIIMIDSENIWYSGVEGTRLLNLKRGIFGTSATSHSSGASVTQNVCAITSEAGVPNLDRPEGMRVLQEILWRRPNDDADGSIDGMYPALVAIKKVTIGNAKTRVLNPKGVAIVGGSISIHSKENAEGEVVVNPTLTSSKLWDAFFYQTDDTGLKRDEVISKCGKGYINISNDVFLYCGNLNLPDGAVGISIGNSAKPVTLIVNGNLDSPSGFDFYGVLYITGNITKLNAGNIYGQVAVEGTADISGDTLIGYVNRFPSSYGNSIISEH